MREHETDASDGRSKADATRTDGTESDGNRVTPDASRRDFLKATAGAGAVAAGIGGGLVGSVAAGIPTPKLSVEGKHIKDPQGNTVKLRGVNVADPKRLNVTASARGKNAAQVIDFITDEEEGWHPRVIRIPVQPGDIGELIPGPLREGSPAPPVPAFDQSQLESYLENHLDPIVEQCRQKNVYCIVDYHRHWKGVMWKERDGPINEDLQQAVLDFWKTVAPRYAEDDHVIFEVYNEPTRPGFYSDRWRRGEPAPWLMERWLKWKEMAQPWVDEIREHSDNHVIVGSPGWSQTPEGATIFEEFDGPNLSYTYHTYGGHAANNENTWEEQGGHDYSGMEGAHEEVPIFATEFGWQDNFPGYGSHRWIRGTTDGFGDPILDVFESHDSISWTAWCADPIWLPAMFKRGFETPDTTDAIGHPYEDEIPTYCEELPCEWELRGGVDMGVTIKETLAELRDEDIPAGTVGGGDQTDPTAPSELSVSETTSSSITVTWSGASDSGGSGLDHYQVAAGDQRTTVEAGTTTATLTGLSAGTSYDVTVSAVDGAGNRSSVARTSATTDDGTTGPTPGPGTPTVSVAVDSVNADGSTSAVVTLSNAPNGVSGFDLKVSLSDTSVATVEGASVGPNLGTIGGDAIQVSADGSTATISGTDLNQNVQAGAEDVRLASVDLAGRAAGETEVVVAVQTMDADDGGQVSTRTTGAVLEVRTTEMSPIAGTMPQDVDDDGQYEDLNGNDRVDYNDVVMYFNHREEPAIAEHVAAYDYNDNQRIDYNDVVSLYQEIE